MKTLDNTSYQVSYDPDSCLVSISGTLRLGGLSEYAPLMEILNDSIEHCKEISLDISQLNFLNSSGIAMLSKFIIGAREKQDVILTIIGSKNIPWQSKSLNNLKRLMPALILRIE